MTDIWIRLRAFWMIFPFMFAYYCGWPIIFWLVAFIGGIWEIGKRRPVNFWSMALFFQLFGLLILSFFSVQLTLFLITIVGVNDAMAYFGGRYFNFLDFWKKNLFPVTSPKKTWGGFFYGLISAVIAGMIFNIIWPLPFKLFLVFLSALAIALLAVLGDYVKSKFKRSHEIKDSGEGLFTGKILPGHGGICDRFDAISMAGWGWFLVRGLLFLS